MGTFGGIDSIFGGYFRIESPDVLSDGMQDMTLVEAFRCPNEMVK